MKSKEIKSLNKIENEYFGKKGTPKREKYEEHVKNEIKECKKKRKFEIGKAYQHMSGMQLFICGMADTIYHGTCFIGEQGWHRDMLEQRIKKAVIDDEKFALGGIDRKELEPVSMKEDAIENWFEIPKEDFIKHNTEK